MWQLLSTFIGLPVSIPLGAISLAGASISGVTTALTSKYQKKLTKVTKLVDIVTWQLAVFEIGVSKALNNGEIDEREFDILQNLHLKLSSELANIDRKMESEMRVQLQKNLQEEINEIKRSLRKRDAWWFAYSFLYVMSCVAKVDKLRDIYYQPNHLWKGQKAIRKLRELRDSHFLITDGFPCYLINVFTSSKAYRQTSLLSDDSQSNSSVWFVVHA